MTAWQQGLTATDNLTSNIPYVYPPATALAWNATSGLLNASYAYTSGEAHAAGIMLALGYAKIFMSLEVSQCHAAGLVLNNTVTSVAKDVAGYTSYRGQDAPGQYDKGCISPFIPSTTQCNKQGDMQVLVQACRVHPHQAGPVVPSVCKNLQVPYDQ